MRYLRILLASFIIFILLCNNSYLANNSPKNPFKRERVSIRGIGKIKIGMNIKEAEKVSGIKLLPIGNPIKIDDKVDCYYVYPNGNDFGVSFMVMNGILSVVDVSGNKDVLTVEGAKIGDTEEKIKKIYKEKVKVEPHPYMSPDGHYLIIAPQKGFKIIFETDKGIVTTYRVGKIPEVEAIEGCL